MAVIVTSNLNMFILYKFSALNKGLQKSILGASLVVQSVGDIGVVLITGIKINLRKITVSATMPFGYVQFSAGGATVRLISSNFLPQFSQFAIIVAPILGRGFSTGAEEQSRKDYLCSVIFW